MVTTYIRRLGGDWRPRSITKTALEQGAYMKIWSFFRPNLVKFIVLIVALSLALLVIMERDATSKVTWNVSRGVPLPFLTITEYRGPCPPINFCTEVNMQSIHFLQLTLDILWWHIIACILFWISEKTWRKLTAHT